MTRRVMLGDPNEYPADVSDGFHPPVEEYLEAIHELEEEGVQVIQEIGRASCRERV